MSKIFWRPSLNSSVGLCCNLSYCKINLSSLAIIYITCLLSTGKLNFCHNLTSFSCILLSVNSREKRFVGTSSIDLLYPDIPYNRLTQNSIRYPKTASFKLSLLRMGVSGQICAKDTLYQRCELHLDTFFQRLWGTDVDHQGYFDAWYEQKIDPL